MQKIARNQRYQRRQPASPQTGHRRAVQIAVKNMREKLYSRQAQRTSQRRRNVRPSGTITSQGGGIEAVSGGIILDHNIANPRQRYHPP